MTKMTLLTDQEGKEAREEEDADLGKRWQQFELLASLFVESREASQISTASAIKNICKIADSAIANHGLPEKAVNALTGQFVRSCFASVSAEGPQNGQNRILASLVEKAHPILSARGYKTAPNRGGEETAFEHQSRVLSSFGIDLNERTIRSYIYRERS